MAARPRAQGPWANRQAPRLLHAWPARARAWCRAARGRGGAQVGTRAEEGAGTGGSENGEMVKRRAPLAGADKPGEDVLAVVKRVTNSPAEKVCPPILKLREAPWGESSCELGALSVAISVGHAKRRIAPAVRLIHRRAHAQQHSGHLDVARMLGCE